MIPCQKHRSCVSCLGQRHEPLGTSLLYWDFFVFSLTYLPETISAGIPLGLATFKPCVSPPVLNKIEMGPKNSSFDGTCIAASTLFSAGRWPDWLSTQARLLRAGTRLQRQPVRAGRRFCFLGRRCQSQSPSRRGFPLFKGANWTKESFVLKK